MKKEILIILLFLLISFPAVRALLQPGGFTSHDLTHHVVRQISMDRLLLEGQFPPRWSGELNNGYGYPVFLFNYPLPALIGELFHKLGMGYVDSVKAVLFTSMVMSVLGMYLFLNTLFKDRMAAFLGAIFYLYAPIRFLNVYVSAAVGSALALGIIPFVFWSIMEINREKRWAVWVGGLSLAALILAHNVTALIFTPVFLVFAGILIREVLRPIRLILRVVLSGIEVRLRSGQVREIRVVRELGLMFLLGLGLSAWFWMPATFEAQYTRFNEVFGKFYQSQFPTLWQLLRSPWGYGLSHPKNPEPGDMSYQLGLIHILVIVLLSFLVWVRREVLRLVRLRSPQVRSGQVREIRVIGGFALGFFILSVFLMLKVSLPLWEGLPLLALVQFPLRFSAIAIFSASIGSALLIKYLPYKKVLFIIFIVLVVYANRNHWKINQVYDPGEDYYLNLKTTSTSFGEHLPKWGKIADQPSPGKLEFIGDPSTHSIDTQGRTEWNRSTTSLPSTSLPSTSLRVKVIRDKSAYVLAEVEASEAAVLRFNQFYFPGWEIKVDGKQKDFNYLGSGESYGLPLFDIDPGSHLVEARFINTTLRNWADGISVIIFIIFIIYSCRQLTRK